MGNNWGKGDKPPPEVIERRYQAMLALNKKLAANSPPKPPVTVYRYPAIGPIEDKSKAGWRFVPFFGFITTKTGWLYCSHPELVGMDKKGLKFENGEDAFKWIMSRIQEAKILNCSSSSNMPDGNHYGSHNE